MGSQYFLAVNKTKKEYFDAHEIGGSSFLGLWCRSHAAGVMLYLLRKSDGKLFGRADILGKTSFAGRQAADKVCIVGEYDGSKLYEKARSNYRNIAKTLVSDYNKYVEEECGDKKWSLTYKPGK